MLKLIMPMISLLLLSSNNKKMWMYISYFLMISSLMSIMFMYNPLYISTNCSSIFFSDNLSSPLITLTMWITSMMILASQNIIINKKNPFFFLFIVLSLNLVLISTFSSHNIMLFYILFELSLIPTLILILSWGYQPERLQAGMYLMMYTITASLPLLISILILFNLNKSMFMMSFLIMNKSSISNLFWLMTIMAFMVKMPMYTTHLWLPKAHVEAPVSGSMILAGILLKLGGYGMLRMSSLFMWMNNMMSNIISCIAMWGAFMTSMICIRQSDMKSLIAYSSVGHMGLLIAGIMSNSMWGWYGALMLMIAHGLVSSSMFAIANMMYESSHSRSMYMNKGMLSIMPSMSMLWFMLCAMNMAAPPSINLMSEILLLSSIMYLSHWMIFSMFMTSFLTACYSLILYTCTQHGQSNKMLNSINYSNQRNMTIIIMHMIPVLLLISSPQFILSWF